MGIHRKAPVAQIPTNLLLQIQSGSSNVRLRCRAGIPGWTYRPPQTCMTVMAAGAPSAGQLLLAAKAACGPKPVDEGWRRLLRIEDNPTVKIRDEMFEAGEDYSSFVQSNRETPASLAFVNLGQASGETHAKRLGKHLGMPVTELPAPRSLQGKQLKMFTIPSTGR